MIKMIHENDFPTPKMDIYIWDEDSQILKSL